MLQKHYLEAKARGLVESCPGQARYLLWAYNWTHEENSTFEETCPHCFQLLVLDNSRVQARNYTLSFKEAKLLRKCKNSTSVLLVTCRTCNRTVKHHGKSRSFLSALKSNTATATSKANLKTPKRNTPGSTHPSHKMSDSKGKRTPASGQSTPVCSSRSGSKRKKHFSQLKALLRVLLRTQSWTSGTSYLLCEENGL
ncbi:UPF0711 protein C18orf21 homolog [Lemmus lemmus]